MVDSRGWYFVLKTAVNISVETICYRLMDYERFEIVVQFFIQSECLARNKDEISIIPDEQSSFPIECNTFFRLI